MGSDQDIQFQTLFETFGKKAFRLELLQVYDIDEEREDFQSYIAREHQQQPSADVVEWCDEVLTATKNGKSITRVRLIKLPLSDYIKYEIETGYKFSIAAGEEIKILLDNGFTFDTEVPILTDFWLFDDSTCVLMNYNRQGKFKGFNILSGSRVLPYVQLQNEVLAKSARLKCHPEYSNWLDGRF